MARRSGTYTIGEIGRLTGTKTPTIRYYEQIELISPAGRTQGNQRIYDEAALERLGFVRHARELGFTLDAIRDLLSLADEPDRQCNEADAIAREQLAAVEIRLASLARLRDELNRMITQCGGGRVGNCRVLQTLGNHSLCLYDHGPTESVKGQFLETA